MVYPRASMGDMDEQIRRETDEHRFEGECTWLGEAGCRYLGRTGTRMRRSGT